MSENDRGRRARDNKVVEDSAELRLKAEAAFREAEEEAPEEAEPETKPETEPETPEDPENPEDPE